MTEAPDYTITPVSCGTLEIDWENLVFKRHRAEKISAPCILWVVQGHGRVVIVDSGPGDPETVLKITGRTLKQDEPPERQLERLGVRPADVSTLVLSHLHWDHSGGLDLFPNADIYVHRRELEFAIAPVPVQERPYEWGGRDAPPPRWLRARSRMKVIEREFEIAPGLRVVHLPGHTPGCIGLCCATRGGRHLIACDAVPTYENIEDNVPPGWSVNLIDAYDTLAKIREIADVVLPSHDARVLAHASYPVMNKAPPRPVAGR